MKKQKLTPEEKQKKIIEKINDKFKKRAVKCPYCGYKIQVHMSYCPQCKLTKQQMVMASNTLAKKIKKEKTGEKIVMSRHLPFDVSFTKLLLYNIFLGWWLGFHCFYVGRNVRGFVIAGFFWTYLIAMIVLLDTPYFNFWARLIYMIGAVGVILSAWDLSKILLRSFRVPVRMGGTANVTKPRYT